MKPVYYRTGLLFAFATLLSACGVRDRAFDPVHFHPTGVMVPPEIVLSAKPFAAGDSVNGLYPVKASSGYPGVCCLIATRARIRIRKNASARTLILTSFVPDLPQFHKHPQRLIVIFPQFEGTRHISKLSIGFNSISVRVPRFLKRTTGLVPVQLECTTPWLVSGQRYGVILTSAYFE
jgi:hypothetical protein